MSKIKMRCISCGKWFQSANAKEVTCPDCTQKARREKQAAKNAPPPGNRPTGFAAQPSYNPTRPSVPPKPKTVQGGTNQWLDKLDDVKIAQPDQPSRPRVPSPPAQRGPGGPRPSSSGGPGQYRDERNTGSPRGPAAYHMSSDSRLSPTIGQRPRQPMAGGPDRGPGQAKPWQKDRARGAQRPKPKPKTPRAAPPPKPKREKIPPPQPFAPTPEQVTQVEERYIELATPSEYDGIRTQIAHELGIPKKAIKTIIKELRARQKIPSWWELQTYKGSSEELDKIKATYEPYLPVPPVGVHKLIADTLELKPGIVYQAIKAIRLEMNLPQYNDPELHGSELAQKSNKVSGAPDENAPAVSAEEEAPSPETRTEQAIHTGNASDTSTIAPE